MENNQEEKEATEYAKEALEAGKEAAKAAIDLPLKTGEALTKAAVAAVETTIGVEKEGLKVVKRAPEFWHGLGPGITTGAADDDPSGIGTYSQAGSQYGLKLLWLAPFSFPLMAIVQEMCARIGLATGRGLASVIKRFFPKWVLLIVAILVLAANSFNIGADLGAMAKSAELLAPWLPFWFLIIAFVVLSLTLQIFISYQKYAKYLKYLALILLVYVISAFAIKGFPWREVLKNGFIPSLDFSRAQIILICGILGTTISPYLFFWETSQEVEERISEGKVTIVERKEVDRNALRRTKIDVWVGMFLSNLVMFFIIAVCGVTLFPNGITNIETAAEAASALKPLAGNYASLLFSLGIIGTGLLGIPILAGSASYAVSETFGWKEGLYLRFRKGIYFYGVIILSMIIGLLLNFIGINPMKALIYAAIVNGLVAPVILVLIVLISSNKKIMNNCVNSGKVTILGWIIAAVMVLAASATIISFFYR